MAVPVGQRNVPDTPQNRQLDAGYHAMLLATNTLHICSNQNIFKPEYNTVIINDLIETAKNIYIETILANDVIVRSREDWETRERKQLFAIDQCRRMIALTNLARHVFHLRGRKVFNWQEKILTTKALITSWHQSDVKRYSYLTFDYGM
jgi:hypothetical protein